KKANKQAGIGAGGVSLLGKNTSVGAATGININSGSGTSAVTGAPFANNTSPYALSWLACLQLFISSGAEYLAPTSTVERDAVKLCSLEEWIYAEPSQVFRVPHFVLAQLRGDA
ncbi:unnamed protein product, partial [Amoebophrya sp. A120]